MTISYAISEVTIHLPTIIIFSSVFPWTKNVALALLLFVLIIFNRVFNIDETPRQQKYSPTLMEFKVRQQHNHY